MELAYFIKETMGGIARGSVALHSEYGAIGAFANPHVSEKNRDLYEKGGTCHTYRQNEAYEFDLAGSASAEIVGVRNAGHKILSVEAAIDRKCPGKYGALGRVKSSIPTTLPPRGAEARNKETLENRSAEFRHASKIRKT